MNLIDKQNTLIRRKGYEIQYNNIYVNEFIKHEDNVLFDVYRNEFLKYIKEKDLKLYSICRLRFIDNKIPRKTIAVIMNITIKQLDKYLRKLRKEVKLFNLKDLGVVYEC